MKEPLVPCRPGSVMLALIVGLALLLPSASATNAASAAESGSRLEAGRPFVQRFGPSDYGAHPQNWAITQGQDGRIYVANADGVLEFDGVRWRLIELGGSSARSLALGNDGRIHVGAQGEVGVLEPNADGVVRYRSLMDRMPAAMRDFSDVWRVWVTDDGVWFGTVERVMRYADGTFEAWEPEGAFHLTFAVGNRVFVRERGRGLLELIEGDFELVAGGERFAQARIDAMLPLESNDSILVVTGNDGLFRFEEGAFTRFETEADEGLKRDTIYHAVWLPDGRLALATIQGGVYLFDRDGRWERQLDRDTGLAENTIIYLFSDRDAGLWLASDSGLSRVEIANPLSVFDVDQGLPGIVISVHRHQGELYAGTNQGLFRLDPGPRPEWVRVEGVQREIWDLESAGDALLAASYAGVFEVEGLRAELLWASESPTYALRPSARYPGRVYLGTGDGLAAIRRSATGWAEAAGRPEVDNTIRRILEQPDGSLWLSSERSGVTRVVPGADGELGAADVTDFASEAGLSGGSMNYAYAVAETILFATVNGLSRFDAASARFVPDERFTDMFPPGPRQHWNAHEETDGRIWMHTLDIDRNAEVGAAVPQPDGSYAWSSPASYRPLDDLFVPTFHADGDGTQWFGGAFGLYRHDRRDAPTAEGGFPALISGIRDQAGQSLRGNTGTGSVLVLPYEQNRIRFEFAAPSYDDLDANRYQVRLDGLDTDWSVWSDEPFIDYGNLWEGDYTFRVRARNRAGVVSEEASYAFSILAPWYRSAGAYAVYLLAFGLTLWGGQRWRFRRLEAQKRVLEAEVAARTAELVERTRQLEEATVTDQLTGLKNRRYLERFLAADIAQVLREHRDAQASGGEGGDKAEPTSRLLFFMVDIDHFKPVNDIHGHAAGDRVLEQISELLVTTFRDSDTLVRWGGEEFLAIARFTRGDHAAMLAERLRTSMAAHDFDIGNGKTLKLTCSIGFTEFPFLPQAPEALDWNKAIDFADHCLYAAKKTSRNAWVGVFATGADIETHILENVARQPEIMGTHPGFRVITSIPPDLELRW